MAFKDDITRQMNAIAEGVRNPTYQNPSSINTNAPPPQAASFADLQRAMGARPTGEVLGQFHPTDPAIGLAEVMPPGYSIKDAGKERAGIRGQIPPWRPEVGNDAIKDFVGGDKNLARGFNAYPSPAQAQAGYAETYSEPSLARELYGNPNARASGPANYGVPAVTQKFTVEGKPYFAAPSTEVNARQPVRVIGGMPAVIPPEPPTTGNPVASVLQIEGPRGPVGIPGSSEAYASNLQGQAVPSTREPTRLYPPMQQLAKTVPPQGQPRGYSPPPPNMGDTMASGSVPKSDWWENVRANTWDRVTQPNPGAPQGINLNDKDFRVAGGLANILNGVRSGRGLGVAGGIATLAGVGKEIYDERKARLAEQARPYTLDTPRTGDVQRTVAEDMARRVGPMGLALSSTAASTPAAASPPTTPPGNRPLFAGFADQPVNMAMARPSEPTGLAGISSEAPATAQGGVAPGKRGDLDLSGRPFAEAYAIARQKAADLGAEKTGQFMWNGKAYQTNRAPARGDERYIPASQQTKLGGFPTLNEAVNAPEPVRVFEERGIGQPDIELTQQGSRASSQARIMRPDTRSQGLEAQTPSTTTAIDRVGRVVTPTGSSTSSANAEVPGTFMGNPVGYGATYNRKGQRTDWVQLENGQKIPLSAYGTLHSAQTQEREAAAKASKGLTPQQQNAQTQGRLLEEYGQYPRAIENANAELAVLKNQLRAQGKSDEEINSSREVQTHQANIKSMQIELNTIEKKLKMKPTNPEDFSTYGEE